MNSIDRVRELKALIKRLKLKVLFIDIETSPILGWFYALGKTHIGDVQIEQDSMVTSISYMFEGEKKPHILTWDFKAKQGEKDKQMLIKIVEIMNSSDIIIGQNGDNFDLKTLQWRLNVLNLTPREEILTLDTLKLSRKSFRPPCHKQDYRSKKYGFGGKIPQDMTDCILVAKGDKARSSRRAVYNIKDVLDLRRIFWKELNYYIRLPSWFIGLLTGIKSKCPDCGSLRSIRHGKRVSKSQGEQQRVKCTECARVWTV